MPFVTSLYAGLLGLILIGVAFVAGSLRGKKNISVGDGGDKHMLLAMRRHANFIEYVPMALILIGLLEMKQVSATAIHALGIALVVGRLAHAFGIKADNMKTLGRFIGATLTMLVIAVASVWLIVKSV
jgi:uncharacterized membrane protein YecN with MAPEG domain